MRAWSHLIVSCTVTDNAVRKAHTAQCMDFVQILLPLSTQMLTVCVLHSLNPLSSAHAADHGAICMRGWGCRASCQSSHLQHPRHYSPSLHVVFISCHYLTRGEILLSNTRKPLAASLGQGRSVRTPLHACMAHDAPHAESLYTCRGLGNGSAIDARHLGASTSNPVVLLQTANRTLRACQ